MKEDSRLKTFKATALLSTRDNMNKKRLIISASIAFSTLILLCILLPHGTLLNVKLAYATDEYGNDIDFVQIDQNFGTWILVANLTASNQTIRLDAQKEIRIIIGIRFNKTLAINETMAINYTLVMLNLTKNEESIWLNENATYTESTYDDTYYYIRREKTWIETLPNDGESYICTIEYYAYY